MCKKFRIRKIACVTQAIIKIRLSRPARIYIKLRSKKVKEMSYLA